MRGLQRGAHRLQCLGRRAERVFIRGKLNDRARIDAEFARSASDGAREQAKKRGFKIIYDRSYPPATTDFSPMARAVQAANPDIFYVAAYPPDNPAGRGLNSLAYVRAGEEGCTYNVWSRLGRAHLELLLDALRVVRVD